MNRELRKMCNAVNRQIVLLSPEYSEDLKQNHEKYLADVEELNDAISDYLKKTTDLFQIWCDASVQVFSQQSTNIFLRMKIYFRMFIVNHNLKKYSYEMHVYKTLQKNISHIQRRLIQYDIFD